jgi:ATP-dependent Clp protease protease subunit
MKAQGDKAKLIIYGEISSDKWDETEITPNEVKELLDSVKNKDLDIFINSSGGNVFAGLAIYHMLKRHEGKKTVYVDGIAASIASIIAMAGDEIHIPKNAYLMIHRSWICTAGNKNDLLDIIAMLEKTDLNMADIYYEKALEGVTSEKILELMDNETWLTGKEAQSFFKIIADGDNKAAACLDGLNINDKTPGVFKAKLNKVEEIQNKEEEERIKLEKAKLKLRLKMED